MIFLQHFKFDRFCTYLKIQLSHYTHLHLGLPASQTHDDHALPQQSSRDRQADTRGRARHHRDLVPPAFHDIIQLQTFARECCRRAFMYSMMRRAVNEAFLRGANCSVRHNKMRRRSAHVGVWFPCTGARIRGEKLSD